MMILTLTVVDREILSGGMRGVGMPYGTRWRNWRAVSHSFYLFIGLD
jgi:hypothetical protein